MNDAGSNSQWMPEIQYDAMKVEDHSNMSADVADYDEDAGQPADLASPNEPNIMYIPLSGADDADDNSELVTQEAHDQEDDEDGGALSQRRRSNTKRKCRENAEVAIASSLRRENDDEDDDDKPKRVEDDNDDDQIKDDGSDVSVTPTKPKKKPTYNRMPTSILKKRLGASAPVPERKGFFSSSKTSNKFSTQVATKPTPWSSKGNKTASIAPKPVRTLFNFNGSSVPLPKSSSSQLRKAVVLSPPRQHSFKSTPPKSGMSFTMSASSSSIKLPPRRNLMLAEPKKSFEMPKPLSLTGGITAARPSQALNAYVTTRVATTHLMSSSKGMQTDAAEVYPVPDRNERRRAIRKIRVAKKDGGTDDKATNEESSSIDALLEGVRYKCKYCEKLMRTEASMRRHITLHTNRDGYGCAQCDAHYATRDDLRLHERVVHEGECNFRCSACNYLFVRASYLRTHVRTQAHKDVVAGKAKPKPQVFNGGLPMHSKPPSDQRRPINKKIDKKITDGPEWDTIVPPELRSALIEAHRKQQERLEEARRNVIRAAGGKIAAATPAAVPAAAVAPINAAVSAAVDDEGPARADGVPKVVSGTAPPAAPLESTPPPSEISTSSSVASAPPTEESLQKFLAQLIRRQGGPTFDSRTIHQKENVPVKIYRYNYCGICKRYVDDPSNPLGMRLHRHTMQRAALSYKEAEEKKSTDAAEQTSTTTTTTTSSAGTDTSDLHVNNLLNGDSAAADEGAIEHDDAVNKLSFWKNIDVKLDVPYHWEPERTLEFVYKKKPGFIRALESGVSDKFLENRSRPKRDYSNFERSERKQTIVLQNVDFTDPEMLSYLNFDSNSSLKPPSKFASEKVRKSYYDPLRRYTTTNEKGSGEDPAAAIDGGPAVMYGKSDEYDFYMGNEDAENYVRVRIDKWQQAIKMIVDLRTRINHYEQTYGVEEPAASSTQQMSGSLNHGYSAAQQLYTANRLYGGADMSSGVLMDDENHYTPAGGAANSRNAVQKPTAARRSARNTNSKRRKKDESETSSDDNDEDDDDDTENTEEDEEEQQVVQQQQGESRLSIRTRGVIQQAIATADAAKRSRGANASKTMPIIAPAAPQQTSPTNKHNTRAATRHVAEHQQVQPHHSQPQQNNRYQPASTHGLIEPSIIFPAATSTSSSAFNVSDLRNMVNNNQQQQSAAHQNSNQASSSSLYIRADEPQEVQRLLQQGWTISGLLPANSSASTHHLPSMANAGGLSSLMAQNAAATALQQQQQQQHSYQNWR